MADLRYFMNIRYRGRLIPDHEGDELANVEDLREHALATAHDLVFRTRMDSLYDSSLSSRKLDTTRRFCDLQAVSGQSRTSLSLP